MDHSQPTDPPTPAAPPDKNTPHAPPAPSTPSRIDPATGRLRDPGSPGIALFSWLAVIAVVGVIFIGNAGVADLSPESAPSQTPTPTEGILELLARYAVGAANTLSSAGGLSATSDTLEPLMTQINDASITRDDHLRAALIAIELDRPDDVAANLNDALAVDADENNAVVADPDTDADSVEAEGAQGAADVAAKADVDAGSDADAVGDSDADGDDSDTIPDYVRSDADLIRTLSAGGADALSADDAAALVDHHGWFAQVALTHGLDAANPARKAAIAPAIRVVFTLIALAAIAGVGLLVGIVLLIVILLRFSKGAMRLSYAPPAPGGSVYLETFALFLIAFLGVELIAQTIAAATGFDATSGIIWLLPLVLLWPIIRGARGVEARHALGWHKGKGVFREMGAGVVGYLAGLPVLGIGFLMTLVLLAVASMLTNGSAPPPTHPVVERAGDHSLWGIASLFLLASVWAPITEESMFRGAFLHHLRGRWGAVSSAAIVGFVFAIIHPQGILLVPPLMALGFNFAMIRQWRGSIIGSMTAHALHNAILMTVLILAMS